MILWTATRIALGAIRRNLVRSLLTALGIVIGVASVIAMVQLGESASRSVTQQIASLGPNLLTVHPGVDRRGPGGVRSEATPFDVADASALETIPGIVVAPVTLSRATLVVGNANYTTSVAGSTEVYFPARGLDIARGRSFDAGELASGAAVCIVGQTIVEELFPSADALGASLRVGRTPCRVIGVLAEKGELFGRDQDDLVVMPIRAVQRRVAGNTDVNTIFISVTTADSSSEVQRAISDVLRRRRGRVGEEDDFYVRDMQEISKALRGTTATLTLFLGAIAAVSLVVGGIGIMNIMLVSVTERTREIGIRLAIGARAREVMLQFLVEAVVLSTLGGACGIALGVGGSVLAARALDLPLVVSPAVIALAFCFSAAIGVLFGFVPARRAALLDPIEALRRE